VSNEPFHCLAIFETPQVACALDLNCVVMRQEHPSTNIIRERAKQVNPEVAVVAPSKNWAAAAEEIFGLNRSLTDVTRTLRA
jgi:hypothetical protein